MTPEWNKKRQSTVDWLLKNFPKTFETMKPLKVGIFSDIRALELEDKPWVFPILCWKISEQINFYNHHKIKRL